MNAPLATFANARICCCVQPVGQSVSSGEPEAVIDDADGEFTPPVKSLWKNVAELRKPSRNDGLKSIPAYQLLPNCGPIPENAPPSCRRIAEPFCPMVHVVAAAVHGVFVLTTTAPVTLT